MTFYLWKSNLNALTVTLILSAPLNFTIQVRQRAERASLNVRRLCFFFWNTHGTRERDPYFTFSSFEERNPKIRE
ncbi:uncharacterized protein BX664DRAFT_329089 [Halteromyces radiatus]|uniref:uncharacterized protein n=1 Tax=Halteromyces radiatus TaxID=101107 RepID=UPI00222040F0|nr:uncharacterized protein BX664DRAFT_329089 [Halteromyces radiatus]KAI8093172.1 hypothetical protein BX664DRAFT_329089 [Halteromyces radiatus]